MFVEGTKNGNYWSVSIAHSLRGAIFLGGAAPAVAGAGLQMMPCVHLQSIQIIQSDVLMETNLPIH